MSHAHANAKCYLTADRNRLVEDGSKDARYLFAVKGDAVPASKLEGVDGADFFFGDAPIEDQTQTPEDNLEGKVKTPEDGKGKPHRTRG